MESNMVLTVIDYISLRKHEQFANYMVVFTVN
jgi:hypothetical protein